MQSIFDMWNSAPDEFKTFAELTATVILTLFLMLILGLFAKWIQK
jgi:hypothetical protein